MKTRQGNDEPEDIWQDAMIKEVLKERPADDIAVLNCPQCGGLSYYNEGSHFSCRFCEKTFYVLSEDEAVTDETHVPWFRPSEVLRLADCVDMGGP